VIEPNPLYL